MYESEVQQLREVMEVVVGDDLRTISVVGPDFFDVRHVREDVVWTYDSGGFEDFFPALREVGAATDVGDTDLAFGDRRGVVLHYDRVVVLAFPIADALVAATYDVTDGEDVFDRVERRLFES